MDQGGEAGGALDAPVVSSVPGERGPAAAERARLQPREPLAAGQARPLLLAVAGGESPDQARIRVDAPADLGTARADGLTQDPLAEGIWRSNEARADRCLGDALKWRGAHSLRGSKSSRRQTSRAE